MVKCISDSPAEHVQRVRIFDFDRAEVIRMLQDALESKGHCAGPAMGYSVSLNQERPNDAYIRLAVTGDGVDDTRRKYA